MLGCRVVQAGGELWGVIEVSHGHHAAVRGPRRGGSFTRLPGEELVWRLRPGRGNHTDLQGTSSRQAKRQPLASQQTVQPAHLPPLSSCPSLGSGLEMGRQPRRPITRFQEPKFEVLHEWVTLPSPTHSSCTGASGKELSPMKLTSPIPPRVGSGLAPSLKVMRKAQGCEKRERILQYSCLENPMDRGAWRATVHGVAQSKT